MYSTQTQIAIAFLRRYGELFGRGRVLSDSENRRYLPGGYLKKDIYDAYTYSWTSLCAGFKSEFTDIESCENPLSIKTFFRAWRCYYPYLRLSNGGRDFCDFCTSMTNYAKVILEKNCKILCICSRSKESRRMKNLDITNKC